MADLKTQLTIVADASGVETGVTKAKKSLATLGATAASAGEQAAAGVGKMGASADATAKQVEAATKRIVASIQLATAKASATSASDVFAFKALQKGIDPDILKPYLDALDAANAKQKIAEASMGKVGMSAAATAAAMRQVPAQITDIVTGLAAGQAPLTVFLQQGGQLKDVFGGVVPAAKALGTTVLGLINPLTVGGAAAAAFAYAIYSSKQQSDELRASLLLTNNAAGQTAGSLEAAAQSVRGLSGGTIGQAREALQGLVASGQFGPTSINASATAVVRFANVTGESMDDVIKAFSKARGSVAQFALEADQQVHSLTAGQLLYIKSLESQGKTEDALRYAADKLNDGLAGRQRQLGAIETALKAGKQFWSDWWDSALAIGREQTIDERVQQLRGIYADAARRVVDPSDTSAFFGRPRASDATNRDNAQENLRFANMSQGAERDRAATAAQAELDRQRDLLHQSEQYQNALRDVALAGAQQRLEAAEQSADQERVFLDNSYQQNILSLAGYQKARLAIEQSSIAARAKFIAEEIAQEQSRRPGSEVDSLQQQKNLTSLFTQQLALRTALLKVQDQYRRGELQPDGAFTAEAPTPQQTFNAFERAQGGSVAQTLSDQRTAAMDSLHDLIEQNRTAGADLIRDDRLRGQTQIDIDVETWRKRIDLAGLSGDSLKEAEDAIATFRLNAQQRLTEQLKPEWQKQLEGYTNLARVAKDTIDQINNDLLRGGEDAFARFATSGKLSLKSIGQSVVEDAARGLYRSTIGSVATSLGFSSGAGSEAAAAAGATVALNSLTAAATAAATALGGSSAAGSASSAGGLLGGLQNLSGFGKDWDFSTLTGGNIQGIGGNYSGGFFDSIASLFAGGFADGGTIPAGRFGLVGERWTDGPELISGPATVTPMSKILGMAGRDGAPGRDGSDTKWTLINNTRGHVDHMTVREISPGQKALIIEEAKQAVAADMHDPNSRVSRAMGRSFKGLQRNR